MNTLAIIVASLAGVLCGFGLNWLSKTFVKHRAAVLYKKGWDAALDAHRLDSEGVPEGLYDEHHPNPLHIPIGARIDWYMPYSSGPVPYVKKDASTFQDDYGNVLTINDMADGEYEGASWKLVQSNL